MNLPEGKDGINITTMGRQRDFPEANHRPDKKIATFSIKMFNSQKLFHL